MVSSKRRRNKKAWARNRKGRRRDPPRNSRGSLPALREPSEFDQIGVVIVEEQLGLPTTDLQGLRALAARLPVETSVSLLSMLAGRVEPTITKPTLQLAVAEEFFGRGELVETYR
jgi:hypothetical protein